VECTNAAGQELGYGRLKRLLAENATLGAADFHASIVNAAAKFYGDHPRDDDVTVILAELS
jgi:serine phosphatase RsbU (regulator of sigma subunit)